MAPNQQNRIHRRRRTAAARGVRLLAVLALLAAPWPGIRPAQAEVQGGTFNWTGAGDGNSWSDSCNWYPEEQCEEDYPGRDNDDDVANLGMPAHVEAPLSITLKDLNLAGGAQLRSGELEITGKFSWSDGWVGAKITIADGAEMELSNPSGDHRMVDDELGLGQIDIYGTVNVLDEVEVDFLGDTVWNNHGTVNLGGGVTLQGNSCCVPPTSNLNNYGTLVVVDPLPPLVPDEATISGLSVVLTGTIQVPAGITLTLGHGNHELRGGSTLAGGGRVVIGEISGDPVVTGTVEIASGTTLELRDNNLGGIGTLSGSGTFNWTGGEIEGELTVGPNTTLHLSGPDQKRLQRSSGVGGVLTTQGPVTWTAGGELFLAGAAIFNNHGQFNGGSAPKFQAGSCCQPPVNTFNNFGTFHVTSGTTTFAGVFIRNQGTFSVTRGTTNIASGATYSQTAGTTLLDNAAITATAGVYVMGGKLEGTGVITGPVHNHAEVRPGRPTGILKVAGNYTQHPSGKLFIEIAGEGAGTGFDQLQVTGQAALTGTLNASVLWPYEPAVGLKFPVVLFGTRNGVIGTYEGMELPKARFFKPVYNAGDLTLVVWGRTFLPALLRGQ